MVTRYTKLRIRRRLRNQKKSIGKVGEQAGEQFEGQVLDRWRNLKNVRRFVTGWLVLVTLLILGVYIQGRELDTYYLTEVSVPGGTFREGVVGNITNMNPLFATSAADRAAAELQFSSLFTYNSDNRLVGDLARSFTKSEDGTVYTVELRDDVRWHDGEPFNADDVVFTYEAIQHPDTRSYLNVAWRDVKVQKKDEYIVTFALPNPFTPFPHSLAEGGIVPEHILGGLSPSQLRGHAFNTAEPIGTGPFEFEDLLVETSDVASGGQLRLVANEEYYRGEVDLDKFVLTTFNDREIMAQRFREGELSSVAGLTTADRESFIADLDSTWYDLPLNNIVFIFFKTSDEVLADRNVRLALSRSIDQLPIHDLVANRFPILDSPILPNQLGYTEAQLQVPYDTAKAQSALAQSGWVYKKGDDNDGFRYKDGQRLKIEIITQNSDDFPNVAREIARQWALIGVDAQVTVVNEADIQQNNISTHNYQTLLFGISFGAESDSFVYWHSSQSGVNGFNLSEIEDEIIDEALESGRTREDPKLREAKYATFLEEWRSLAPAYALYRPSYSYVQRSTVAGFVPSEINTPSQRYYDVHRWRVNTDEGVQPY